MGEFNAVILSVLLVVAIFAAIMVPMSNLYEGLVKSVSDEITVAIEGADGLVE